MATVDAVTVGSGGSSLSSSARTQLVGTQLTLTSLRRRKNTWYSNENAIAGDTPRMNSASKSRSQPVDGVLAPYAVFTGSGWCSPTNSACLPSNSACSPANSACFAGQASTASTPSWAIRMSQYDHLASTATCSHQFSQTQSNPVA